MAGCINLVSIGQCALPVLAPNDARATGQESQSPWGSTEQRDNRGTTGRQITEASQLRHCGSVGFPPIMAFIPQTAGVLLKGVRGLLPWKLRGKSKYVGFLCGNLFYFLYLIVLFILWKIFEMNWYYGGRHDGLWLRQFCSTFVWQMIFSEVKLSPFLSRLWIKTVDVWLLFGIATLRWFFIQFAECGIVIWEPVWSGELCF